MIRISTLIQLTLAGTMSLSAPMALAHENEVEITRQGGQLCFTSNGSPPHDIGQFPNSGNPHAFVAQTVRYCVDGDPALTGRIDRTPHTVGVTLAGIPIRPGTADYYDAGSPRGHSRDPSSGWNLEGMGSADALGMDQNNAHVDERGLYHYHGVSNGILVARQGTVIGYAADGFPIQYIGDNAQSSWRLKSGTRPTAPGGAYDGSYEEDWLFVSGSGNLDECNGAMVDGEYAYFATDTFPFFPRCFKGTVSSDFTGRR